MVVGERLKVLVAFDSVLFVKDTSLVGDALRLLGLRECLVANAVPNIHISVLAAANNIVHRLRHTGFDGQIFALVPFELVLLCVVVKVKESEAGVIS
jgi:hypothetical protein